MDFKLDQTSPVPFHAQIEKYLRKLILKKEYKKLDSKIIQKMVFSLLGGLGIFLLGMRYMSDGIQKIAGPSLKKCIKMVTNNRFLACTAGVFLTLLVQSSSVTTVMAVGFVNSGIMALQQAIGVILGANIGTTMLVDHHAFSRIEDRNNFIIRDRVTAFGIVHQQAFGAFDSYFASFLIG